MNKPTSAPASNGARRYLILLAVCLSGLAMPLSFTGPAVALPTIAQQLGGSPIALNWVTNAFMLAFGSCLMAAGALADSYGRKRLFMIGVTGFIITSLALAFSPDIVWLDILRAAQGVASAAAFAGGAPTLAQEFEGYARTRAFSMLGTTFGVGLAFGPILSGLAIEHLGWRAVFHVVTAICVIAFFLGLRYMRESRDPDARGLDWPGALTFTAALTLFTYAVLQAPESGWSDTLIIGLLIASIVLMSVFVLIENRVRRPMLDLSLFRYPRFIGVQFLAAAPAYSYVVLLVLLPVRFIGIEGYSAMEAGRMMIALSGPMLVFPVMAGMLTRWMSPGLISGLGLLTSAAGLIWLAQCPPGTASGVMAIPLLLIGLGISFPWGLMDGLAVSVVPKERAGMAMGIFSTTRVAGEGVALALVAALLAGLVQTKLHGMDIMQGHAIVPEAAQRLAMGDLSKALNLMPDANALWLVQGYGEAFHVLLYVLSGITVLSAIMVFGFLTHSSSVVEHHMPSAGKPRELDTQAAG